MAERWDVFISYAHEDEAWVRVLAENLHRAGQEVFFDRWEVVGGSRLSQRLQQGLESAGVVVPVVSRAAVGREWWQEEFAAAMAGAVAGVQRLIPVLLDDVPLPPFVASRVWVDFRDLDAPAQYEERFAELLQAVQGVPSGDRPQRGGGIKVPPGVYRAEGPRAARLRIDRQRVVFSCADREWSHAPLGVGGGLRTLLWEVQRARSRPGGSVVLGEPGSAAAGGVLHGRLTELGRVLGSRFLAGDAGVGLAQEVARSRLGVPLRLAVQVDDPEWADLPWETLVLPGQQEPLVLQQRVQMYRAVPVAEPVAVQVPGPLRILAVIASPERGGGDLLDYEAELAQILAVVDPSRREQNASVRVLNWGSRKAIRQALAEERFHVLHISCHAAPGVLVLESDTGQADEVTAREFVDDVLVDDHGVPLVVLAGCSTALADRESPQQGSPEEPPERQGEQALAGLASDLLHAGVPAVLAMTAAVTDRYATELCTQMYQKLARRPEPVALTELSMVRRELEKQRRQRPAEDPGAAWAEWATPALFLAGPPLALYRRADGMASVPARAETAPALGGRIRRVGDFVGRRAELRSLLRDLRAGKPGVVLHGIGGIGKSSLAAQLVDQLGEQAGLVVPIVGHTRVDLVIEEIRQRLRNHCLNTRLPELHPHRQAVAALGDRSSPWEQQLALIRDVVLPELPILLVLDNAEDNLTARGAEHELRDQELAAFLSAWVRLDRTRLLVTSRYPFPLPQRGHRRLAWHHLGPLSEAETRKMIWRLPALDALTDPQRHRAYTDLGGHPRSLEYLDALLRGGQARFDDVADRLEVALEKRGITQPQTWLGGVAGDLDRALAETITLTVNDVLLPELLDRLDATPLARRFLLRAAVYRHPVDRTGLAWQIAEIQQSLADPDRDQRMRATSELITQMQRSDRPASEVGLTEDMLQQHQRDWDQLQQPPLAIPPDLDEALTTLLTLGLIAPLPSLDTDEATGHYLVHRWTAAALTQHTDTGELIEAHRRAAQFWHWRVGVWPQDSTAYIQRLAEARYHHHQASDLDNAFAVTYRIVQQLHIWGAWTWEEALCTETLTWLPPRPDATATLTGQLGIIALERGHYVEAEQRCHAALTIFEELGDRAGIAASYHQLGRIAQHRRDYAQAEQRYQAVLTISEELGDRAGIAASFGQFGRIALARRDYAQAEQRYQAALTIYEELGDRFGIAVGYHELGVIAQERGDYAQAEQRYQAALTIHKELGNQTGIARSYGQLGATAQLRGDYAQAEQRYQASLIVHEELGDRAGIAIVYRKLGDITLERGDYVQAEQPYQAALTISEELGDRAGIAASYNQLGRIAVEQGDYVQAEQRYQAVLTISEELGDRAGIAASSYNLGVIAHGRGDYVQAEQRFQAVLTTREELGDRAGIAISYRDLGRIAVEQGDYVRAEQRLQAALVIEEELSDRAAIALERGDYVQAEQRYQAVLTISEKLGDRAGIARCYHHLGVIAQRRGNYAQAEQRFQAALTISEELDDRTVIAASYNQLGRIAVEQGDYVQAEQRFQAALTISEELDDRAVIAIIHRNLSAIAHGRGDYVQAEQRCQAALTIEEELGNRAGIAIGYRNFGAIALERGDYAQAEERYQVALTICEELGDRAGIARSSDPLGRIALERGDYIKAEQRYQVALTICEKLGNRSGIAASNHQLGVIARHRGVYVEAEQHYQTALTIHEELGDRAGIATTKSQLGALRTEQGRPAEGIPFNITALEIRRKLESPEVSTDMLWLARQRQEVGEEGFTEILGNLLDANSARFVIDAVKSFENEGNSD